MVSWLGKALGVSDMASRGFFVFFGAFERDIVLFCATLYGARNNLGT